MDCKTNEFVDLEKVFTEEQLRQKQEIPARFIEFPIGQRVAINGYWFETEKVENNRLILKPIGMTNSYRKVYEGKK